MITNEETIKHYLKNVIDRDTGQDVISAGLISGIVVRGGKVGFVITIAPEDKERKGYLREACENAVKRIAGVEAVTAVLTAQGSVPLPPKPEAGYTDPRARAVWNLNPVENVRHVIAVASGKGGVGKSTTAVNLAFAMHKQGKRVGLLDADIYGPSLPRMLGLQDKIGQKPDIVDNKMVPYARYGITCMSMAFITGGEATILRGPMISKTLQQLLRFTRWGTPEDPLDYLVVDMPPGTGDIHLSLVQQVPLTGAIIVTTPQEVAVMDAAKCLQMFQKVEVPILGVIENMSYYTDNNGSRVALFGEGGGRRLAESAKVPFLGEVPVDPALGTASDQGLIYSGTYSAVFGHIAQKL